MRWFRKSSSAEPASPARELESPPGGPVLAARKGDPVGTLERFSVNVASIGGQEWVVIDDLQEAVPAPPPPRPRPEECECASAETGVFDFSDVTPGSKCREGLEPDRARTVDGAIGDSPMEEYFGLSDEDGIIIRFNVVEHRPSEGVRKFAEGIDYPGRKKVGKRRRRARVPVGIEAKEVRYNAFLQFMRRIRASFKRLLKWTNESATAPPRLQALRTARRTGGGGGPGEGVRAYALHLAADKTTVFAQNVDNFIACTKDSKETCPHVVMRNMRQFMSGMKNYLVKHGEREFEREVEKERLKLKANEFLNLDSILEGVLHGAVVTPLRAHVYALLAERFARRGDVALLTSGMRMARGLPPLRLGVRPSVRVPSEAEMVVISRYLVKMQEADSPLEKLENLLSAISAIFNAMKSGGSGSNSGGPLGADDFLPVLVLTLARCGVPGAELEAELMAGLLPPPLLAGEGGYYLTTLFGAVAVLKRLAASEQDKNLDCGTGTLGSLSASMGAGCGGAGGVARVLVPDEMAGALRCVSLPWRPGARARDLCRALAHRARITNPQDYGLFALRDGEETLLGDADCPQDLVGDKKSANCMLAYKRFDAKIAWPKQALQSYP